MIVMIVPYFYNFISIQNSLFCGDQARVLANVPARPHSCSAAISSACSLAEFTDTRLPPRSPQCARAALQLALQVKMCSADGSDGNQGGGGAAGGATGGCGAAGVIQAGSMAARRPGRCSTMLCWTEAGIVRSP